jgi:hypothetical protein
VIATAAHQMVTRVVPPVRLRGYSGDVHQAGMAVVGA